MAARHLFATLAFGGAVALAGCGDIAKSLGGLEGQENFQTVKAPPLSLPPDYNLRPPVAGGRGAPSTRAATAARQTVFGINQTPGQREEAPRPPTDQSMGEKALVNQVQLRAGSTQNIRSTVDQETEELKESERGFVDKVLKWDEDAPEGETVNPEEEQGIIKTIVGGEQKPEIRRKGGLFN